jgi:hypothetical protein
MDGNAGPLYAGFETTSARFNGAAGQEKRHEETQEET